jgi:hypothetical protein
VELLKTQAPYIAEVTSRSGIRLKVVSPEKSAPRIPHEETFWTNHGARVFGRGSACWRALRPPLQEMIVFLNCLDLYHESPDSGERQYESRT